MIFDKVLVVDDNPTNLKLARVVLSSEGLDVRTAVSAEDALQVLDTFTPALILMDLQLPGLDGLELTRQLKADPKRHNIAVLALTAYAMKGDMEKALAAGCDGYVSKPIDPVTLCSIVAHHLKLKGCQKQ
jgi:two-component system, cell cycle response regulator DivK